MKKILTKRRKKVIVYAGGILVVIILQFFVPGGTPYGRGHGYTILIAIPSLLILTFVVQYQQFRRKEVLTRRRAIKRALREVWEDILR